MDVRPFDAGGGAPPDGATTGSPNERRSIPELVRSVVDGITQLFRQEVALAKIEVTEAISERAFGIGAFVLGGVFIVLVVVYLAAAGVAALDLVMPAWASRPRGRRLPRAGGIRRSSSAAVDPDGRRRGAHQGNGEGGPGMGEAADRVVSEIEQTRARSSATSPSSRAACPAASGAPRWRWARWSAPRPRRASVAGCCAAPSESGSQARSTEVVVRIVTEPRASDED